MPLIPAGSEVVAGTIAETIVESAKWALRSCADLTDEAKALLSDPDAAFSAAVADALSPLLDVPCIAPELGGTRFRDFLASADLYNLLQRLFLVHLADRDGGPGLREEFLRTWALWTAKDVQDLTPHCDRIFGVIDIALSRAAERARSDGLATAVRDSFHSALVANHLAAIDRRLALLSSAPSLDDYVQFELDYRKQLADRFSRLTPPHLDDARRVRIDHIYVDPRFSHRIGKAWSEAHYDLEYVRASILRTVLLGQPGGGKSTLTAKLCYDLSSSFDRRLVGGTYLTAVPVVLRDYGQAKVERKLSILEHVAETARSDFQLQPPEGVFEYMMQQGRALVIFDGLDELVAPSRRKSVRDDIESFCARYPAVRVLVTAREIGYDQAPLDPDQFSVLGLAEFDNEQVEAYVHRWFAAIPDISGAQKGKQATAFLTESASVANDLRRNPLLLALMCNIYKGEGYIPTNRPGVYEKCSNMLLRRWDASRGIEFSRPLGAHLERTLQHVANWMFHNADLQAGVPESRLLAVATDYLAAKRFEDVDVARIEAQNFLDFCKGRAWVLVEVGVSKREALFQFAHRTFLEYFTADYLVRNSRGVADLWGKLAPKLGKAGWDVVAQLAFQLQNSYQEDAGDELLLLTLARAREIAGHDGAAKLAFAVRALEFLVPTPRVTRTVVEAASDRIVAEVRKSITRRASSPYEGRIGDKGAQELLASLGAIGDENVTSASGAARERLEAALLGEDRLVKLAAAEVLAYGTLPLQARKGEGFPVAVMREVLEKNRGELAAIALESEEIAQNEVIRGHMGPGEFVDLYGAGGLFRVSGGYLGTEFPAWADFLLFRIEHESASGEKSLQQDLAKLGSALLAAPTPWLGPEWRGSLIGFSAPKDRPSGFGRSDAAREPDVSFGVFMLSVPYAERLSDRGRVVRFLLQISAVGEQLASMMAARGSGRRRATDGVTAARGLGWSEEAVAFASKWVAGEVNVVGGSRSKRGRR